MTVRLDNLTRIWANANVDHVGFGLNIAAANGYGANSKVARFRLNGNDVFTLDTTGNVSISGSLNVTNFYVGNVDISNIISSLVNANSANSNNYSAAIAIDALGNYSNGKFLIYDTDLKNISNTTNILFDTANSAHNTANASYNYSQ